MSYIMPYNVFNQAHHTLHQQLYQPKHHHFKQAIHYTKDKFSYQFNIKFYNFKKLQDIHFANTKATYTNQATS